MKKYIMPNMRIADMDVNNLFATSGDQIEKGDDITEGQDVQGDARTTTSLWDQEW